MDLPWIDPESSRSIAHVRHPHGAPSPGGSPSCSIVLFVLPIAAAAGVLAYHGGPVHWRDYDRKVESRLPPAAEDTRARVLVMTGRTRGWKGRGGGSCLDRVQAARTTATWQRYDVAGWGNPVRLNWWPPDLWFGEHGRVVLDLRGEHARSADPPHRGRNQGLPLGQCRRLPDVAGTEQQHIRRRRAARDSRRRRRRCRPNAIGRDYRPVPYAG